MREIVGFVLGAAAGAAGALFASSKEGREVIDRVITEARPEVDRAARDWEPVLLEVGRAMRLAAREVEVAVADMRVRLAEIAAVPQEAAAGPGLPGAGAGEAGEAAAPSDAAPDERPFDEPVGGDPAPGA